LASRALAGLHAQPVLVEVHLGTGLPVFQICTFQICFLSNRSF